MLLLLVAHIVQVLLHDARSLIAVSLVEVDYVLSRGLSVTVFADQQICRLLVVVSAIHRVDNHFVVLRVGSMGGLDLAVGRHFDARSMQVVSLHAIEAAKDEEPLVVEDHSLVESARGQRDVEGDAPCPRLQLKVVLMNVIEALQGEVDATEDVHCLLRRARRVPISAFDVAMHASRLQPDSIVQVKD